MYRLGWSACNPRGWLGRKVGCALAAGRSPRRGAFGGGILRAVPKTPTPLFMNNPHDPAFLFLPPRTNDLVAVSGGFSVDQPRTITLNGIAYSTWERRGFLVLVILVAHGLHLAGQPVPFEPERVPFLSAKRIADLIERLKASNTRVLQGMFDGVDDQIVTRLIFDLRRRFRQLDTHPSLLETGLARRGYRLSTPARNLSLDLWEPLRLGKELSPIP
jgi:hypothetical protein